MDGCERARVALGALVLHGPCFLLFLPGLGSKPNAQRTGIASCSMCAAICLREHSV